MNWPYQGVAALSIAGTWFIVVVLIFTALTWAERKNVPEDPDDH